MTNTVISPPIPAYQNLPIEPQNYQPRFFFIEDITQGPTTIVTTTTDHDYVIGQLIRLIIPPTNGIRLLNGQLGYVISIPADDQVEVTIYSVGLDPFITSNNRNQPQILPVGDVNTGQTNANGPFFTTPYIPGSFIDISPA